MFHFKFSIGKVGRALIDFNLPQLLIYNSNEVSRD